MAAELNAFKKNPLAAVEVAVGDPFPKLISQKKGSIYIDQFYKKENTRFILKKARFSRDDVRVFDSNGNVALVSHHPGKNPYESLDPLGLANTDAVFSPLGEWESLCNITSYSSQLSSLEIRPKTLTIHGRQYLRKGGKTCLNIAKLGKMKTLSIRDNFGIFIGDGNKMLYKVTADLYGRTLAFRNTKGEQVAVMAKTRSALIKTAVFGSGMESTIDIARGVDVSLILASIFGIMQVGNSLIKDAANNFLFDPIQDKFQDECFNVLMGDEEESYLLGWHNEEGYTEEASDDDYEGWAEPAEEEPAAEEVAVPEAPVYEEPGPEAGMESIALEETEAVEMDAEEVEVDEDSGDMCSSLCGCLGSCFATEE